MKKLELVKSSASTASSAWPAGSHIARVIDVPSPGVLTVRSSDGQETQARMTEAVGVHADDVLIGREVLVIQEGSAPGNPVAMALMQDPSGFSEALATPQVAEPPLHAKVDGQTVVIQAKEKLELRCGKASIVIDANGKITIKGAHLLNRATGPIRIKGGHVDIN